MVDTFIMPQLEEQFAGKYEIKNYDINKTENVPKLIEYQEKFNITKDEPVSMVINQARFVNGYPAMEEELLDCIKEQLENKTVSSKAEISPSQTDEETILNRFKSFTFTAVALAGLLDGINPCVFATLIFFISLLSVSKIKGRKLLLAGSVYCFACFISYLALGFGLFRFLKIFSGYKQIQLGINIFMACILGVMAVLSFRDAWRFKKTGKSESVDLQLPRSLKLRIHAIMRRGLAYKHLVPGAFIVGVLVTAIESVCTGQVYVPTLVYLTKLQNIQATGFLLLYNIAFILPLLAIFALAYYGFSSQQLIAWSKKEVVFSKILMALFFIVMAGLILIF